MRGFAGYISVRICVYHVYQQFWYTFKCSISRRPIMISIVYFFLIYEFSSGFIRKIYERGIRVIAHWIYLRRVHILMVETEEFSMMIIWGGTLAILLNRFRRNLFRVTRINHDIDAQIKRIGVYYMCIDDLPI